MLLPGQQPTAEVTAAAGHVDAKPGLTSAAAVTALSAGSGSLPPQAFRSIARRS